MCCEYLVLTVSAVGVLQAAQPCSGAQLAAHILTRSIAVAALAATFRNEHAARPFVLHVACCVTRLDAHIHFML